MTSWAIVDAGPLISMTLRDDAFHRSVNRILAEPNHAFVIAGLALAEAAYFVAKQRGGLEEAMFVQTVRDIFPVEFPESPHWPRIVELMRQYADFPLGLVDASVIA